MSYFYIIKITQFLSTLSLRRATIPDREPAAGYLISIHALLAESDPTRWAPTCRISNFYPRSPCGERLKLFAKGLGDTLFLSTLSLRRATIEIGENLMDRKHFYPRSPCGERQAVVDNIVFVPGFLSTLSLRRATPAGCWRDARRVYFYPRSPCGERLFCGCFARFRSLISIHALLAESDSKSAQNSGALLRI